VAGGWGGTCTTQATADPCHQRTVIDCVPAPTGGGIKVMG
jgi:hypothetical protein